MTVNMNQFSMNALKGQLTLGVNSNVITARINPASSENNIPAGAALKLVDTTSAGEVIVDKAAATDDIFGFLVYSTKENNPTKGDRVQVAFSNCIMIMEASEAIAGGALVEIVAASNKIALSDGTNNIVGKTLRKCAADGDLIPVLILAPLSNQVIASADLPAIAFTDLSDTPANYTGAGSDTVKVTAGADGLEFVTV